MALGGFAALAICAPLLLGSCQMTPPVSPAVTQVVLMWLNHPERSGERAQLIRAAHSLRMIPGVLRVQAGGVMPLVGAHPRRDFDLGVAITFRNRAALQRYQRNPRRSDALRRYLQPLVRRYEVYHLSGR